MRTMNWLILILTFVVVGTLGAQNQNWVWANQITGVQTGATEYGDCIAYDGVGNVYAAGNVQGNVNFGSILSVGSNGMYLTKMDVNGNYEWIKRIANTTVTSLSIDANGDVLSCGSYTNTAVFGDLSISSVWSSQAFVAKISSDGDWIWAITTESVNVPAWAYDVYADSNNNVYVTGTYSGSTDPIGSFVFGDITLPAVASSNIFIAKLDAQGIVQWAEYARAESVSSVVTDEFGNVYISGYSGQYVSFNGVTYPYVSSYQYLAKFSADDGEFSSVIFTLIGVLFTVPDGTGGVYAAGHAHNSVSNNYTSHISRIDANGSIDWTITSNTTSTYSGRIHRVTSIAGDGMGNLYVTGWYKGDFEFGNIAVTSDIIQSYVTKVSSSGEMLWFKSIDVDRCNDVSANAQGDIYLTGNFIGVAEFDDITLVESTNINYDIFVARLSEQGLVLLSPSTLNYEQLFINHVSDAQKVMVKNNIGVDINLESIHFESVDEQFNISIPFSDFTLSSGETDSLFVLFEPNTYGNFTDYLVIVPDSLYSKPIRIKLTGKCVETPPSEPQNVSMEMIAYDAHITWDAVAYDVLGYPMVPDYYFVYYNGSQNVEGEYYFHGLTTTQTQYIHSWVGLGASNMFYRVKAISLSPGRSVEVLRRIEPGMSESEVSKILLD